MTIVAAIRRLDTFKTWWLKGRVESEKWEPDKWVIKMHPHDAAQIFKDNSNFKHYLQTDIGGQMKLAGVLIQQDPRCKVGSLFIRDTYEWEL